MLAVRVMSMAMAIVVYTKRGSSETLCYTCNGVDSIEDCNMLQRCQQSEVCYMYTTITSNVSSKFYGGCTPEHMCCHPVGLPADKVSCRECCDGNFCNNKLCSLKVENIECFNCTKTQNPKECFQVATCKHDEMCGVFTYADNSVTYRCENKNMCDVLRVSQKRISPLEEYQLSGHCCNTSYCNQQLNLSSSQVPSTTITCPMTTPLTSKTSTIVTSPTIKTSTTVMKVTTTTVISTTGKNTKGKYEETTTVPEICCKTTTTTTTTPTPTSSSTTSATSTKSTITNTTTPTTISTTSSTMNAAQTTPTITAITTTASASTPSANSLTPITHTLATSTAKPITTTPSTTSAVQTTSTITAITTTTSTTTQSTTSATPPPSTITTNTKTITSQTTLSSTYGAPTTSTITTITTTVPKISTTHVLTTSTTVVASPASASASTPTITSTTTATTTSSTSASTTKGYAVSCAVCDGGICGLIPGMDKTTQCPEEAPFCINTLNNDSQGRRVITKRCSSASECEQKWWQWSSDLTSCTDFDPRQSYMFAFTCYYCCTKELCNVDLYPKSQSLYVGSS